MYIYVYVATSRWSVHRNINIHHGTWAGSGLQTINSNSPAVKR